MLEIKNKAITYLEQFCCKISGRHVGSEGNRQATSYVKKILKDLGWDTELQEFDAIDWEDEGADVTVGENRYDALVSPYSLGCEVEAELIAVSSIEELAGVDITGKAVLLHSDIAKEQIMPKNFVFYNPDEHKKIIKLLETKKPAVIICATGRNSALAGGAYPFPLIEDGDFDIPSVYMTDVEGERLLEESGRIIKVRSVSKRIPGKGYNVIGYKGKDMSNRLVVTAHIDSKKGSPGAIDNATGVTVLLLLAELLKKYDGDKVIELVAFNGEDYYSVPGQMRYIAVNENSFSNIKLNINIDGAGYLEGPSAISFYELPEETKEQYLNIIEDFKDIIEGLSWPQGDHSIFVQLGVPAVAITSKWFTDNMDSQEITHTNKDNLDIVDVEKLIEIAEVIRNIICKS